MPISDFNDLHTSLCELMHTTPSELERDEDGVLGFTLETEGVVVGFMEQLDANGEAGALMMVQFGQPDLPRELEILRELLDDNFLLFGVGSPAFARHPFSGVLSLHQSWWLAQTQVQQVYRDMTRAIQAAAKWQASKGGVANVAEIGS